MALPDNRKRARTADDKQARRVAILSAARRLIDRAGVDGATMSALAGEADVSKGALYLYFGSKEEVLLALFVDAMEEVVTQIETEADAATLIDVIGRAPSDVPLFVPLLARLMAVIEPNVADGPLFAEKRRMHAMGRRVAAVIVAATGAPEDRARAASTALLLTMQGAAQFDIAAQRDPATIPDDLRAGFAAQAFARSFPMAARLILDDLAQA